MSQPASRKRRSRWGGQANAEGDTDRKRQKTLGGEATNTNGTTGRGTTDTEVPATTQTVAVSGCVDVAGGVGAPAAAPATGDVSTPAQGTEASGATRQGHGRRAWVGQPRFLEGCRSVGCYEKLNVIDEGQYGVVYRAACRETGRIYALKLIKVHNAGEGFPVTSLREIHTLLRCRHTNVVGLEEIVVGRKREGVFLVMEYADHELRQLLYDHEYTFAMPEIKCLMRQLLAGLAHMHERWVVHRDLKTSNLLYCNSGELKIADFGLARCVGRPQSRPLTPVVCTLWYRAPEVLLGSKDYGAPVDMWAAGCVFAELILCEALFQGDGETDQLRKIVHVLGTPSTAIWPDMASLPHAARVRLPEQPYCYLRRRLPPRLSDLGVDLLQQCLAYDPSQRITAKDALAHPWFSEAPLPQDAWAMPSFRSANEDGAKRIRRQQQEHLVLRGGVPQGVPTF